MTDQLPKRKGGYQARRAAQLCQDARFHEYLDEKRPDHWPHSAGAAATWLREACGVASRAELDHSADALAMFRKIQASYNSWRDRQRRMEA